jgi:Ca-activated chloride channel family protein
VAIYPKEGTFWSDHPVGIVNRDWVTDEHRAAARTYLDYLLDVPQQQRALAFGFRPGDPSVPLGAPIDRAHGVDPAEPMTTLEVPPAEVMDAIIKLWHERKKKAHVTLVLDVSGSMKKRQRLVNAKQGARQLLSKLGDADLFSLLPFSDTPRWAAQKAAVETGREQLGGQIDSLFASGGTALYDAVASAFRYHQEEPERDKISAIVVLTDGADTDSRLELDRLIETIRSDAESKNTRVFTIGYGSGANKRELEAIAEATRAKFYDGKPENIEEVFKEIATFF